MVVRQFKLFRFRAKRSQLLGQGIVILIALQCIVVFASWLCAAVIPECHLQSLLSSDGIRWQYGQFVSNLSSSVLVYILLAAIAYGSVRVCRQNRLLDKEGRSAVRQKIALRFIVGEWCLYTGVTAWLTCIPHALLLGVDGHLLTGYFARSIVPQLSFMVILNAITYGYITGAIKLAADLYRTLTYGLSKSSAVVLYYMLLSQLYWSVIFVVS